jgi:hypothetical protein
VQTPRGRRSEDSIDAPDCGLDSSFIAFAAQHGSESEIELFNTVRDGGRRRNAPAIIHVAGFAASVSSVPFIDNQTLSPVTSVASVRRRQIAQG